MESRNIIRELIEKQARDYPHKPAIIFQEEQATFSQLQERVFRLANNLAALGVRKGDHAALFLPNRPEYIYSYLALFCLGATVVPLDYMLKNDELEACLNHSQTTLLIFKPREDVSLERIQKNVPGLKYVVLSGLQAPGHPFFDDLTSKGSCDAPKVPVADADLSLILYTSGSTGRPKGVSLNYRHLTAAPRAMEFFVDLTAADVKLSALPFSHAGGLVYIQNCLFFAITLVVMERFIPLEFLKNIERYRVTCFHLVPSMYYALLHLKEFEKFDLGSLRWVNVFGAPNSPDAIRRFRTYCPNAKLLNGWGLTETNAPNLVIPLGSDKIESIGRPAPWIEVKIVDDEGREVPAGEFGEIILKSWVVMEGYYRDPQMTQEVLRDGWFHTGDLARRDAQGMYYIVGRKKDMIKVSGQLVFPPEVEEALHKHPMVKEVAVIGVPDALRGESIRAYVVAKEGQAPAPQELRQFCREHLAHFKLPHDVVFVAHLPKTTSGKVDKAVLKQELSGAADRQ